MALLILLLVTYVLAVFFFSRFFIPYLGFSKSALPAVLPRGMEKEILLLRKKARSKKHFLKVSYDYLGARFEGGRFRTFIFFHFMFKDLPYLWNKKGFVQCTILNHFLRIFLVRSGYFKDEEVRLRHTFLNFNIHQYVQVKINGSWVDVDVSWKKQGVPLGRHAFLFG